MGELVVVGQQTYGAWRADRTMRLGAGLAYYGLFAFVPVLALSLGLAEAVFRQDDVQEYFADFLEALFGPEGVTMATAVSNELAQNSTQAGLGVFGLLSLLVAASLVVIALQDAINTIWDIPVQSGMEVLFRRRLMAFGVVLATGAILTATLVVQTAAAVLNGIVPDGFDGLDQALELLGVLGSWGVIALALTLLFRYMTPAAIGWRLSFVGGFLTAVLATMGTWVLSAYLRRVGGSSLAGVAGSAFLVLLWIYYEAQILLGGVQLVRVLHRRQ